MALRSVGLERVSGWLLVGKADSSASLRNGKAKSETQIPFGNDKQKRMTKKWGATPEFANDK
jgi:hypothetical protein